jgi:hypothetical protein
VRDEWAAREREEESFELLPENEPAAEIFLACATQWRLAGMSGIPTGMDYAGVQAAIALMGATPSPALFDELRDMEAGALKQFAKDRG